jgi:predicted O-methyltransferase YrrM
MTRYELLASIIKDKKYKRIVEVGIFDAETASYVLGNCKSITEYVFVDNSLKAIAKQCAKQYKASMVLEYDSVEAAKLIDDKTIDLVFIDADHKYDSVRRDIDAWLPKVKKGGIICGHDYDNPAHREVKKAVDEIFSGKVVAYPDCYVWRIDVGAA